MLIKITHEAVELRPSSSTVGQRIEESESEYRRSIENIKNNSRRKGLMEEIISTERRYVEGSLRLLVQEYMPEMDRSDLPVGLVGRGGQIFGNVNVLYEAHLEFLPALEACKTTDQIADCFLQHDNLFKLYPLYARNKPVSDSVMKDYGSYFTKKQKQLRDPLDLASYLLTPIQRLGKYCLLMKSLTRECEKENICNEKVKKATEMLQQQMSLGNNLIATDSIVGCEVSLREQGGLLLRDTFTVSPPTKRMPFEAMVFLFQEALIITCIHRQNASEEFVFREVFKLTDMGYTSNNNENLRFQVWFRKMNQKTYTLKAKKPSVKEKWTKQLHTLLWQQFEANKIRKKKEQEELGLKPAPLPVSPRPISIPTSKRHKLSPKFGRIRSSPVWYTPEN
ncbi:Puratrophin-1-like [Carabus blaptoides fortunei]